MERIRLNKIAHQKFFTSNPSIILSASIIIKALMTRRNNPRVRKVMGMVKMIMRGLMVAFKRAKSAATRKAVPKSAV